MAVHRLTMLAVFLVAAVAAPLVALSREVGAARSIYFPQTGHNVAEPFLPFFERYGGVATFGLPLTESFEWEGLTLQYFERARLEHHANFATGQQIAIGQIGRELTAERLDEQPFRPVGAAKRGATLFEETGHTLRGTFADFWRKGGGLAIFGLPISEEFPEELPGVGLTTVQYFERARFELTTTGTVPGVRLGLLGAQSFRQGGYPAALLGPAAQVLPPEPRALTIPVLEYHDVGFGVGTYQVTMPAFVAQIDWLQANGYQTVTLHQVYQYMFEGGTLPPKPVVLTFDDGRASQWNAVQELNKRGMIGVFFVLGGTNALTDAQIRQLIAWGHVIEGHTMSHAQLSRLSDEQLHYELVRSKQNLEAKFGVPIRYLAYPYGDYDRRVINAVIAAGYAGGIAAWGGGHWTPEKRWEEPRIIVDGYATLGEFVRLVQQATP